MRAFVVIALVAASVSVQADQTPSALLTPDTPKTSAAISGVVTDAATGQPIEGAVVSLGVTTGGPVLVTLPRTLTDAKGRFLFRDLAPATKYYLNAAHVGYVSGRYGAAGPAVPSDRLDNMEIRTVDDVVTISVAADQWVSDLHVSLWRLGSLSGRVVDERGEPVVGAAVRGFSTAWVGGHAQFVGTDVASTDDRGQYRLANVLPGQYAVSVLSVQSTVLNSTPEGDAKRAVGEFMFGSGPNPGMPAVNVDGVHRLAITNFAVPPPPSAKTPRAYAPQFYPHASTIANAQFVDVTVGSARHDLDFRLQPVPAVRVSGRVLSSTDASSLLLRLMPAGSEMLGFGCEAATTVVERDGSFTFLNVPAGEYTVLAQTTFGEFSNGAGEISIGEAPGFPSDVGQLVAGIPGLAYQSHTAKTRLWGRASVAVGSTDITDVVVPLHPTTSVSGRVVISDSPRALDVMMSAQPADGAPSRGQLGTYLDSFKGEAPFSIQGFAGGTYLFHVAGSAASVVSVTTAGRDVRDTGIDTSAGDISDVVITLTANLTSLQGTVTGDAAAGAAVIVFPVDHARWVDYGLDPLLIKAKAADRDGVSLLKGVPAGDYFAVAVDRSQHDAWTHPAFLEAASAVAKRVTLQGGEKKTLDLPLSKVVAK